jgi:hypothetical protein
MIQISLLDLSVYMDVILVMSIARRKGQVCDVMLCILSFCKYERGSRKRERHTQEPRRKHSILRTAKKTVIFSPK